MGIDVRFRGRSGKAWDFKRVPLDAPWARTAGVALFAAPDTYGWRIIRTIELSGKPNDVQPIWALADAERYGARAVFLATEFDARTPPDRERYRGRLQPGLRNGSQPGRRRTHRGLIYSIS